MRWPVVILLHSFLTCYETSSDGYYLLVEVQNMKNMELLQMKNV